MMMFFITWDMKLFSRETNGSSMKIGMERVVSFWDGYLEGGIAVSEKAAWKKERKLHKFRWLNETWPPSSECLSHYLEYLVTCGG